MSDFHKSARRTSALSKALFGVLVVISLMIFVLWRTENPRLARYRLAMIDAAAPALEAVAGPSNAVAHLFDDVRSLSELQAENARLRERIGRLESWRSTAQRLEEENARLRALAKVTLPIQVSYVTAEVIGDAGGPFSDSVLVNVGLGDGVEDGAPALDAKGLIGRAVGVGERSTRVLLLTDPTSRVPVRIGDEGVRAILIGDETGAPLLEYTSNRAFVPNGARIETSGKGGVFPKGLLVGRVAADETGAARAALAGDFERLEFLRILRSPKEATTPPPSGRLIFRIDSPELLPDAAAPAAAGDPTAPAEANTDG